MDSVQCRTAVEARDALREVARRLFGSDVDVVEGLFTPDRTYAATGQEQVHLLAEAGRLLARCGSPAAMRDMLRIAFRVWEGEREAGPETPLPELLRGLAHVALGSREMGLRSLLDVQRRIGQLAPADRPLCFWGLASAALADRDVHLCREFTARWCAEAGPFPAESERSRRAFRLISWLAGETEAEPTAPEDAVASAFLGLSLVPAAGTAAGLAALPSLVLARRRLDALRHGASTAAELLELAGTFAAWNVPVPLGRVEALLRETDELRWLQARFKRLLGGPALAVATAERLPEAPETRADVLVLMCDVRGYSTIAEHAGPGALFPILSPLFKIIHEEVDRAGGMVHEFIGDAVLVVFNTLPGQRSDPDAVLAAAGRILKRAGWAIRLAAAAGAPSLGFGGGLTRGPAAFGLLGGLARCHIATLGHTVNTAARIEALTRNLPGAMAVEATIFDGASPEPWKTPAGLACSFRDAGFHHLKNISRPARVFTIAPLLRHPVDFVPMGFVARPAPGVVYLDTGNDMCPGVIDTHQGTSSYLSACEVLVEKPGLLVDHLAASDPLTWEFRTHESPDLDAAASLYAAWELLDHAPRNEVLKSLAAYVSAVDQGVPPAPEDVPVSLQGIFTAHLALRQREAPCGDIDLLEAGLRVIDAACFLADRPGCPVDLARAFSAAPGWFPAERSLLLEDRARYQDDRTRAMPFSAAVGGAPGPLPGIWLDHPGSLLFKLWARTDPDAPGGRGFPLMAVDFSTPGKGRFVISVPPEKGLHLRGLGEALEALESSRRTELGRPRPTHPKRLPADNADPWYFGQGHGYTIVDAPSRGTVLSRDEVLGVLTRSSAAEAGG